MKKYCLIILCLLGVSSFSQTSNFGREYLSRGEELVLTSSITKQIKGKSFKNKFFYVSENEGYISFAPRVPYGESITEFSKFPIFTYLKEVDIVILRVGDEERKVFTGNEFFQGGFQPTNKTKKYFGEEVVKYESSKDFYGLSFWVAEGTSNAEDFPFLEVLKRMGVLNLGTNKQVKAIVYCGLEIPIESTLFKVEYKSKTLNRELFERKKKEGEEDFSLEQIEVSDLPEEILNQTYSFETEHSETYTSIQLNGWSKKDREPQTNTSKSFINKKKRQSLRLSGNRFSINKGGYFIQGAYDGGTKLKVDRVFKSRSEIEENFAINFKKRPFVRVTKKNNTEYDIITCDIKAVWICDKYEVSTDKKYKKSFDEILLPKEKIKGFLKGSYSITLEYSNRSTFEYISKSSIGGKKKITDGKKYTLYE